PESQFQGRARLHNFRMQINERGFANVVPDPNNSVEGLCYLLSVEDEARLDRSEGVPTAYQKKWTEVEFYPAAAKLLGRKVMEILKFDLMGREGRQSMSPARGSLMQSVE
ncbi:gamma-glutamylcyclotransferase, partial [Acidithiobacillus sp. MC6.1]|nr:gamma-glutamylcyclotransferase [Acidithiobacillus sp. MC6.1]